VSEKELYSNWDTIKNILNKNNALYEQDSKLWLKTTKHNDQKDRVVVKEDKNPTYLAGDIIYHSNKYKREYDRYINIWGADHHGYIARVKSSIEYLGFDSKKLDVILIQMVALLKNGKPYKMSKRSGGFILISDIEKDIGSDGINYLFASKKCDTHLEFDLDKLTKQDSSNPLFYINYAHARIHSIFKKADKNFEDVKDANFDNISSEARELLFEALVLPSILEETFNSMATQKLTDYLYELASNFHSFYNSNKILNNPDENSYLRLFSTVAYTIKNALLLLNIEAKNKM
jgi:arginyl-tRNA synthetase